LEQEPRLRPKSALALRLHLHGPIEDRAALVAVDPEDDHVAQLAQLAWLAWLDLLAEQQHYLDEHPSVGQDAVGVAESALLR
jgi:hypothetical protein